MKVLLDNKKSFTSYTDANEYLGIDKLKNYNKLIIS